MPNLEDMLRRERVLADFGDFALRSQDLDEVLTEGCRLIRRALGTDLGKVIEIEQERGTALVRAGIGWADGVVGKARIRLDERSSESYAIENGEPLISRNIQTEERFDFADFLKDAGVVSLVNVPIFLPGGEPYGLLQVDCTEARDFTEHDIAFLRTYSTILGPVIDRLHKVHDLQVALAEKEELMDELQHRIRNNITMIGSIVRIRERQTSSEEARCELRLVGGRVDALRLVHDHLYTAKERREIELAPYLRELMRNLLDMNEADRRSIRFEMQAPDVRLSSERAVPLGLIVNEFATNSLKHAFGDAGGTIRLDVDEIAEDRLRLTLSDNGRGFPAEPAPAKLGSGTGMTLIGSFARQIGTTANWVPCSPGVALVLCFER